jgi:hypothetical protein
VEWVRGVLAESRGDIDRAYLHIERGLRLLDELGMGREVTAQAVVLADLADRRAKPELAERWRAFVEGRAGGLARHDALLRASAQHAEAQHADDAGDPARAEAAHLAAAASYRRAGAKAALAHTHLALADLARRRGDRDRADTEVGLALAEATSAADPVLVAAVLTAAAIAVAALDHRRAAMLLGAAQRAEPAGVDADASVGALTTELRGFLGADTFEEHLAAGRAIDPAALERLGALVSDP